LAGTLRLDDATPMAGARVALTITPRADGGDTATTDAEGRFLLRDAWPGERTLTLISPDGTVLVLQSVHVEEGRRASVDVTVARGVVVAGRVRDAVTREPLPGAWVTLRRPHDRGRQAVYGGAVSDSTGGFRFEHVPPAHVTVEVVLFGKEPVLDRLDVGSSDVTRVVDLAVSRPFVVRYEPTPREAVGERMAWMFDGPLYDEDRFLYGSRGDAGKVPLSEAGEVRLDAPPPGRYHLILFGTKSLPRFEADVDVKAGEEPRIRIPLPVGGRVAGRLVDATGQPIAGRRVGLGGLTSDPTDAEGRFTFVRVAAGPQKASVLGEGLSMRLETVEVAAERETQALLRLPGSATLALIVSAPEYGAALAVVASDGQTVAWGSPVHRQAVSATGFAAGTYRVRASAVDAVPFDQEVVLYPDRRVDLGVVGPTALPVVPVRVVLPPGIARPRMLIVRVRERAPPWEADRVAAQPRIEWDAQDRAWLRGLPVGRYRLAFLWERAGSEADLPEATIDVREGLTTPQDVVIPPK
jgi:hypothetical protein